MYDKHYKECSPHETIQNLRDILKKVGIKVTESNVKKSSIGTYSMRVELDGTSQGANGKGVSLEYCTASAYAELFERLQNDQYPIWITADKIKNGFYRSYDEKILTTAEIVSENNAFTEFYFEKRGMSKEEFTQKVDAFNNVQRSDYWLYGFENKYITLPFYSVKNNNIAYLPHSVYGNYYGSNGMCAGNTDAEALVQGLSEIFERVAQKRLFLEMPSLPNIPLEYLKTFPQIYSLFTELQKDEKYIYILKDCSFGGKYPVAALIVIEKNTGRYGIKLGCHPNYGIALERCFTEATQGRDICEYIDSSVLDFYNGNVTNDINICNSYKIGIAQYPYQIFGDKPTYEFYTPKDTSGLTNADLLKQWIHQIIDEGHDILIRNVSYLGFPSFHIIIPGLSELQDADDKRFRANNTRLFVQELFAHPEQINTSNIKYVIATMGYFNNIIAENTMAYYFKKTDFDFPANEISSEMLYMTSMCYAYLHEFDMASKLMYDIYSKSLRLQGNSETTQKYCAIYHYFTAMSRIQDHQDVLKYLKLFFDSNLCCWIDKTFMNNKNIIPSQYPCNCSDDSLSQYDVLDTIREKLISKQISSGISQETIANLLLV